MRQAQFKTVKRQSFRRYFQPSRVLLGVIPAETASGVNVITLCFTMHCSYSPPMMAVAIHKSAASYSLIQTASEFVLAVPGETLVDAAMFCGTSSMREFDKVSHLKLRLIAGQRVQVPGLADAIANVEVCRENLVTVGDHILVTCRVLGYRVNELTKDRPLVSCGPEESGFEVLRRHGIHRLALVKCTDIA